MLAEVPRVTTLTVTVPAANWTVVPISMAVAALRPVPVILTSLPPPAAPLVGVMAVIVGAAGTVPAGALEDVAGLASAEDATAMVPLVNGVPVLVHEIDCPFGAPQTQPVP